MSKQAESSAKSPNQQDPTIQDQNPNPQEAANATGLSEEERIAKTIAIVRQANPDLSLEEVTDIVAKLFKNNDSVPDKISKEASRILGRVDNEFADKIYLVKDKDRKFPLERAALNGIIVRQTYKKVIDGDEVTVPARNLNEIGIYSQADFDRLNNDDENKPGFAREGILVEVWHKPGDEDTVQED